MSIRGFIERRLAAGPAWLQNRMPDIVLVPVIAAIHLGGTSIAASHQDPERALDAGGLALLTAGPLALLARHRHPSLVLLFVFAATLTYELAGYPRGPIFFPLIVALVTAMLAGRRLFAWSTLLAGYFAFLWGRSLLTGEDSPGPEAALGLAAWLLVLGTAAEMARVLRDRARDAQRTREVESRRRAGEERLRIAQELHDVLAHHISLINVQAGVALHLLDDRPEQARPALAAIKDASGAALADLRSVLDILRRNGDEPPRSPTPGLIDLDDLVARSSSAGLRIETEVEGSPRALPAGVDLAAYRIVQEALTNVARHATAKTARVSLTYGADELLIQVDDDGRGVSDRGQSVDAGRGIQGMRERAAAHGGEVEAGPRPGGGFRVRARLPIEGAAP